MSNAQVFSAPMSSVQMSNELISYNHFSDRIIPPSWMNKVYEMNWRTLLKMDQGIDRGPAHLSEEQFDRNCIRCGRTLNVGGENAVVCMT